MGLDLDSSAWWAMVLYFGHGFGQDPIKNVFKYRNAETATASCSFMGGSQTQTETPRRDGTKLDESHETPVVVDETIDYRNIFTICSPTLMLSLTVNRNLQKKLAPKLYMMA